MKLTQSLVAIAALGTLTSTLSFAGGDINPVTIFEQEPIVVPVEPIAPPPPPPPPSPPPPPPPPPAPKKAEPLGLYVAGGISALAASTSHSDWANVFAEERNQDRQLGFTARLGYDFMNYLGAELRGSVGLSEENTGFDKIEQFGAYLKPNVDVTDDLNLYGLVGAARSNLANIAPAETGLSYGAGLDYGFNDNVSVFTDIVNYMDKSNVPESWGVTVGAAYNF